MSIIILLMSEMKQKNSFEEGKLLSYFATVFKYDQMRSLKDK